MKYGVAFFFVLCKSIIPAQNQPLPGDLNETFQVNPSGGLSYAVPIEVPPGIQQLQPNLELVYNSQGGNDVLGMGWSLSGIPFIERTPKIRAIDGEPGTICYNESDRFSYNGQRLINIQGVYGNSNTVYRTEIESWNKIISLTDPGFKGSGPGYFTLRTNKGYEMRFGDTPDSREMVATNSATAKSWGLSKLTDLNGNSLSISYSDNPLGIQGFSDNRIYPVEIAYTINKNSNVTANRYTRFFYEKRDDVETKYTGGYPTSTSLRLKNIKTYVGAQLISNYNISYEYSPTTGRSLVRSIQRFCDDALTIGLSPVLFTWQKGSNSANRQNSWSKGFAPGKYGTGSLRAMADVNGDGLADVVGFGTSGVKVGICTGKAFSEDAGAWSQAYSFFTAGWVYRSMADVNGDGMADIVGFGTNVKVGISMGKGFSDPVSWGPDFAGWRSGDPLLLSDVNGDGLADVVGFGAKGVKVGVSTGKAFSTDPGSWSQAYPYFTTGWALRTMADVNGDGMADIVGFGTQGVQVGISTGKAFLAPVSWSPDFANWKPGDPLLLSDVNGDGLADVVGFGAKGVKVGVSTGKAFSTDQRTWSQAYPYFTSDWAYRSMADMNGDGMADLVGFGTAGVQVGISTGNAFKAPASWSPDFADWNTDNPVSLADINGDGLADIVGFGNTDVMSGLSAGPNPDRIIGIKRSTGCNYGIGYSSLSDAEAYQQTTRAVPGNSKSIPLSQWASSLGGLYYVVKTYSVESAAAAENKFSYRYASVYKNGLLSLDGRGWMGFETVSTTNKSSSNVRDISYRQDFPYTGRAIKIDLSQFEASAGLKLVKTSLALYEATESAKAVDPAQKILFVHEGSDRDIFYAANVPRHAIGRKYKYDAYGNLASTAYQNLVDPETGNQRDPGNEVFVLKTYLNDESLWRLDFPLYSKVSKKTGGNMATFDDAADLSLYNYSYDAKNSNLLAEGQWDNVNKHFITTTCQFDAFGNRTRVTRPSGAAYTLDYDLTYHTYPISWRSPKNEFGQRLTESYGFDPRFGGLAVSIDYNGYPAIVGYDAFGRETSYQAPAPETVPGSNLTMPNTCSLVTTAPGFKPEKLLTFQTITYAWENNQALQKTSSLAEWPTGAGLKTIESKAWVDGLGRLYKETLEDSVVLTNLQYNAQNQVIKAALPCFKNNKPLYTTVAYDILKRVVRVETPTSETDRAVSLRQYEAGDNGFKVTGRQAAENDYAYLQTFSYAYFANQQKMVAMESAGSVSTYSYDLLGRSTSIVAPPGQDGKRLAYDYAYDAMGRMIKKSTPSRGSFEYRYDMNDQLVKQQQANGDITFTHDSLGRVLQKRYRDKKWIRYLYDGPGVKNGRGQMTRALSYADEQTLESSNAYGFDAYGQIVSDSLQIRSGINESFLTGFQFDPLGRTVAIINPDKAETRYRFEGLNLVSVQQPGAGLSYSGYNAMGAPASILYSNGVKSEYAYSPGGEITGIKTADKNGKLLFNPQYRWNNLRELVSVKPALGNAESFSYKSLRLTGSDPAKPGYAYDQAGNLVSKDGTVYTYKGNAWVSAKAQSGERYSAVYDAMGNMIARSTGEKNLAFTYDARNKLVAAQKQGDAAGATYIYDYRGIRLCRSEPGAPQMLYINPWYSKEIRGRESKSIVRPQGLFGTFAQLQTGASPIYLHGNHQGSTVLLTNSNGALDGEINYSSFGEILADDAKKTNSLYTGWGFDTYTGLYYMDARYYDPKSGRFTSADNVFGGALSRQDALNDYAYVLNSPQVFVDPDGMKGKHYDYWYNHYLFNNPLDIGTGGEVGFIALYTNGANVLINNPSAIGLPRILAMNLSLLSMVIAEVGYRAGAHLGNAEAYAYENQDRDPYLMLEIAKMLKRPDKDDGFGGKKNNKFTFPTNRTTSFWGWLWDQQKKGNAYHKWISDTYRTGHYRSARAFSHTSRNAGTSNGLKNGTADAAKASGKAAGRAGKDEAGEAAGEEAGEAAGETAADMAGEVLLGILFL